MSEFLNQIKRISKDIKEASEWRNSRRSIAAVEEGAADYIYEFYCYIRMLADLKNNYDIKFVPGKSYPYKFPEKPGEKLNFPRFEIYEKGTGRLLYQLCAGTKIRSDSMDLHLHPDISLQRADASEDPDKNDLLFIWDAKYVSKRKRLANGEVLKFASIVGLYGLNTKTTIRLKFNNLNFLLGNCLITNGDSHHESNDDTFLKRSNIKIVYDFDYNGDEKILG